MLRMKVHYFLYMGGISSVVGYTPTLAKQLGYSPMVVGSIFTFLSLLSLMVKPLCGLIVDTFPVKRIMFLTCILLCGVAAFALKFMQKLPTATSVNLDCDTITTLDICSKNEELIPRCSKESLSTFTLNTVKPVECQLICQQDELFWDEMCISWNMTDYCTTPNHKFKNNGIAILNVNISMVDTTDQVNRKSGFQVSSVQIKNNTVAWPVCPRPAITRCEMNYCSNDMIMAMATAPKFEGSLFGLYQFWSLVIVMSLFWISQAITWSLQDPICFDLLGDKAGDFGKQRCWGSVSWGIFMTFGGALVDYFSDNDFEKNYTPLFYLCLIVIICDFIVVYKIEVTETTGSKNTISDVFMLLTKINVLVYFTWIVGMGICTSMIWNYLFWYMEDITLNYQSNMQIWIKTLQGLTIGIQCMGGEVPLFFFSGWIIKRFGHWYCMSFGLLAFSVRFYLYSIITNPLWILPVEFINGITFGLFHAVLMSYSITIAPPSAVTTFIGLSGALTEGVGISIGGVIGGLLYEKYQGAKTFRIFSYGSLSLFVLLIIFIKFFKSDDNNEGNAASSKDQQLNSSTSIKAVNGLSADLSSTSSHPQEHLKD